MQPANTQPGAAPAGNGGGDALDKGLKTIFGKVSGGKTTSNSNIEKASDGVRARTSLSRIRRCVKAGQYTLSSRPRLPASTSFPACLCLRRNHLYPLYPYLRPPSYFAREVQANLESSYNGKDIPVKDQEMPHSTTVDRRHAFISSEMPPAPALSLKERIARLNLQAEDAPGSAPAPAPAQSKLKTTGAVGSIGTKISSFQANAESAPLVPVGSFGLGGVRREPSSGLGGQGRVASLGGGRAAVPLEAVKQTPRSVSAGSPRIPRSEGGSSSGPSPNSSRASTPAPTLAESSDTLPGVPSLSSTMERSDSQMSSGAVTPGAMSASSMSVEGGSYTSGEGGPDPSSIKLNDNLDIAPSPLSSPVLTALVEPSTVEEADLPSPTFAPSGPLKGPLGGLKAPLRSPSSLSVSSMVVEVGDDTVDGGSAMDGLETPKNEEAPVPETIGEADVPGVTGAPMAVDTEQDEEAQAALELAREEATQAELDEYEGETTDVTAPPPRDDTPAAVTAVTEEQSARGDKESAKGHHAEQSEGESEGGGGYGDILDDFVASEDAASPRPASAAGNESMRVECSDCHEKVDLMELADHSCTLSTQSPAVSHTPIDTAAPEEEQVEQETSPADIPTLTPSASAATIPAAEPPSSPSEMTRSSSQRSTSTPVTHEFNPQTESLVPDDILDAYDDDHFVDEPTSAPSPVSPFKPDMPTGLPSDVTDEEEDFSAPPPPAHQSSPVPRPSADLPEDVEGDEHVSSQLPVPTLRSPKPAQGDGKGGRNVQSQYGGFYDDDDEPNYEGGSVTVVSRTKASHKSSVDMTRTSTA